MSKFESQVTMLLDGLSDENGRLAESDVPALLDTTKMDQFKLAADILTIAVRSIICSDPRQGAKNVRVRSVDIATSAFEEEVKKLDKDREEMKESQRERAEIAKSLATDCLQELRPVEFPPELWEYVFDTEKPSVMARFAVFDEVPERKAKVIQEAMNISISEESESRKAERPYFRAMLLANLDRFMHPQDTNIPLMDDALFSIELLEGEETPSVAKYQHFDVWEARFLHLQIKQMMKAGRVERSTSPWNARLQLVPYTARIRAFIEQHGAKCVDALMDDLYADVVLTFYRMCIDLRGVNSKTVAMIYPLPNIQHIFDKCAGSKRYTMGDIPGAFFSVATEEKSRIYLAYTTPDGHFQNMVMAQGAKNAAVKWAAIIAEKFESMTSLNKPVVVYQDDIGNYANSLIEHIKVQNEIFAILRANNAIFKPNKTKVNYKAQRILGQIMNEEGRKPDPKNVEAILKLRVPRTVTEYGNDNAAYSGPH
eukprot:gene21963-28045_t